MPPNKYGIQAPGSYGLQMPPGFASLDSWGSPDVPDPLNTMDSGGINLYDLKALDALSPDLAPNLNKLTQPSTGDFWSSFGGKDGWGNTAIGGFGALASAFLGMKQYGLAKQTLAENKRQFQMNYDAQKQTTNSRLEDRQRARVASNPGAYQSVGDYMGQNRIV